MIGTVTFDGLSQGALWGTVGTGPAGRLHGDRVRPTTRRIKLAETVGLVGRRPAHRAASTRSGSRARGRSAAASTALTLRRIFVHSLVPIAAVYVDRPLRHATSCFEGQAIQYLASDPLGQGWDLFGRADAAIDFSVLSQNATWYIQIGSSSSATSRR